MNGHNGNGWDHGDREDLIRRMLAAAEEAAAVGMIPRYVAEEVPLPPRPLRWVLGYPAMRVGYGPGRWYPRLVYVLLSAILVSVLTLGIWCLVEARAARRASERSEAWQRFNATKVKEIVDAESGMRKRGGEGRGDEDVHPRARDR